MRIVIIDYFNSDYPIIATSEDGETLFFNSEEEAREYGKDMQDGSWKTVSIP